MDVVEADTVQTPLILRNTGSGVLYFLMIEEGVTQQEPATALKTAKPFGPPRGNPASPAIATGSVVVVLALVAHGQHGDGLCILDFE